MKKYLLATILILVGLTLSACGAVTPSNSNQDIPTAVTLFYGDGCSHCLKVEEFMQQNNITLPKKEVYNDQANQALMVKIAQTKCNITGDTIGVPLLWTGSTCLIGDVDIINFLQNNKK